MNVFFKLTKLIFPVLPTMLLALLLAFLTVASSVSLMAAAAYLIARAALHPMLYELSTAIVGVRFFGIARAVCRYGERYVSHDATFRILTRLRVWCYAHIEPLAPARLRGWQSGELFGLLTHEIDLLKDFYLRVLAPPLTALLVLITLAIVLSFYAPVSAALLAVSFLTIALVLPLLIYRLSRAHVSAESRSGSQFKNHCIDLINGMTELTAFNHAKAKLAEIETIAITRSRSQAKIDRINALTDSAAGLIANLTILCALVFWIPLVTQHQISGVQLAVLTLVMQSSFEVVLILPVVWQYYASSIHAARQIFSLAESKPPRALNVDNHARCTPPIHLEATRLSFAYDDDQNVLTDLSLTLRPSERIAIIGASGAGKSTLINLLLQLWEPNGGTIQMNGVDYRNLSPAEIRSRFNVITQHTHIFHGSIKDNLCILHPDVSDDAIWAALKKAELCEFVAALPDGLDTDIGQNGRLLSGGQRQRLALARAFLRPAPILLLDEPTAGLDMITAAKIMQTIEDSRGESAMLLITHQLRGLERMDRILVLHDGKIAEQGNFVELLAKEGMFSTMWNFRRTL